MSLRLSRAIAVAITTLLATGGSLFAQADLSLTFSGGPDGVGCGGAGGCGGLIPIAPGSHAVYSITIANLGPGSANGVVAKVTFPPKTSIPNFGPPGSETCSSSTVSGQPTLTCTQATLGAGSSFAVVIILNLAIDYPWQSPLVATGSVTSTTPDPNLLNNSTAVTLPVTPPPSVPALDIRFLVLLCFSLAAVAIVKLSQST